MHTGEEWFIWGWQQYAVMAVLLAVYLLLAFRNKLPSMAAFKDFLDAINSAGGHIFILSLFTLISIRIAMQFFYHTLGLPEEVISKHDALVAQGVSYVTGILTGSFMGALLKTMSGGKANGTAIAAAAAAAPPPIPDLPAPASAAPSRGIVASDAPTAPAHTNTGAPP